MDTTTYASVAMLPKSITQDHTHFVRQDLKLLPLNLSLIRADQAITVPESTCI